jgi:hypothetical protein
VTVRADFTGAHLLHLAVAGCVLNDLYREAAGLGVELLAVVDRVAEIPRAVRAGAAVGRVEALPLDGPARHADQRADESR